MLVELVFTNHEKMIMQCSGAETIRDLRKQLAAQMDIPIDRIDIHKGYVSDMDHISLEVIVTGEDDGEAENEGDDASEVGNAKVEVDGEDVGDATEEDTNDEREEEEDNEEIVDDYDRGFDDDDAEDKEEEDESGSEDEEVLIDDEDGVQTEKTAADPPLPDRKRMGDDDEGEEEDDDDEEVMDDYHGASDDDNAEGKEEEDEARSEDEGVRPRRLQQMHGRPRQQGGHRLWW